MSRKTSQARHRAASNGNIALQGLAHSAKSHATTLGRPVAIVAITSGLAFSAMGAANASAYSAPAVSAATYTVVAGDTLGAIAAKHGVSLSAVLGANGLSASSIIYPGNAIAIPAAGAAVAAPVQATVAAPAAAVTAPVQQAVAPVQQAAAVTPAVAPAPASGLQIGFASTGVNPIGQTPSASSGVAGTIAAAAIGQIGVNQDCTRLVSNALAAAGINYHGWPAGYLSLGRTVSAGEAIPGDLIYYADGGMGMAHIAVYIGGGQAIHGGWFGSSTAQAPAELGSGGVYIRVNG